MAYAKTADHSDTPGSYAECRVEPNGAGQIVYCTVEDRVVDKYTTRIEWTGPGKSGKDNVMDQGATGNFSYTFATQGVFNFKVVEDKGTLPDGVGPEVPIHL